MSSSPNWETWSPQTLDPESTTPGGQEGSKAESKSLPNLVDPSFSMVTPFSEDVRADKARQEGFRAGAAEAQKQAEAQLHHAVLTVERVAEELERSRGRILQDLNSNVSLLALAVAKKIVLREVELDDTIVSNLVTQAVELLHPDTPVIMSLNPEDLNVLKAQHPDLMEKFPGMHWHADPSLSRGGCRVEGTNSLIDGSVDQSLKAVFEGLAYD